MDTTASPELVLHGGTVRALDGADAPATALAVRGGRLLAVGRDEEVLALAGPATETLDLRGACALPGINDAHLHGAWAGALWPRTVFAGAPDPAAFAAPEHGDAHGDVAAPDDPATSGGATAPLVLDDAGVREAILRTQRAAAALGITSYTEPGLGPGEDEGPTGVFGTRTLRVYRELAAEGALTSRVTALALFGLVDGPSTLEDLLEGLGRIRELAGTEVPFGVEEAAAHPEAFWRLTGVKIFADGVPPARSAWLHGCYPEGGHGALLVEPSWAGDRADTLRRMMLAVQERGWQMGFHATGDRTIDEIVDILDALGAERTAPLRHYLIHGDLISDAAVDSLARLGLGYATQPLISEFTAELLGASVGPELAGRAWPLGRLLSAGAEPVLSSDAPIVTPDWRESLAAADRLLGPATDRAARTLRLLRTVTTAPARQDHAEHAKGTLTPGKLADITVLAEDPVLAGAAALPGIEVTHTIVDGRLVHAPWAVATP